MDLGILLTNFVDRKPLFIPTILYTQKGCGPGNLTRMLCEAFPNSFVDGIDSSPEMINAAQTTLPSDLQVSWFQANTPKYILYACYEILGKIRV